MTKIAVFPGSFDPITLGHIDIINKGLKIFDKVIIAIGNNSTKKGLFPIEKRQEWIRQCFINEKRVEVETFEGLTINFCKENGASFILRGLRSGLDFEYERSIAQMNVVMNSEVETVFFASTASVSHISSTIVREIFLNKGDISSFIPTGIELII